MRFEAEATGVTVALEAATGGCFLSPIEVRELIDAVNSSAIGVCLDLERIGAIGSPLDWIDTLHRRVQAVRYTEVPCSGGSAAAQTCQVPIDTLIQALDGIPSDCPLILSGVPLPRRTVAGERPTVRVSEPICLLERTSTTKASVYPCKVSTINADGISPTAGSNLMAFSSWAAVGKAAAGRNHSQKHEKIERTSDNAGKITVYFSESKKEMTDMRTDRRRVPRQPIYATETEFAASTRRKREERSSPFEISVEVPRRRSGGATHPEIHGLGGLTTIGAVGLVLHQRRSDLISSAWSRC